MIIPVRCVTCGKVLADKWRWYQAKVGAGKTPMHDEPGGGADARRVAMDNLGLARYCCRRHFLGHVDLVHRI